MILFRDMPIQKKLMRIILLISGAILIVTSTAFFTYEFYAFRQNTTQKLSTLAQVIATNSTAALAFDDHKTATEILIALKAEPHIIAAALFDNKGVLFCRYPVNAASKVFPASPGTDHFLFTGSYFEGFQPVIEGNRRLGTLYIKSDLGGMYQRFRLVGITTMFVIALSLLLAYVLSKILQRSITKPIQGLADAAKIISLNNDFSVRAVKSGNDELGYLTDSFNGMIQQIQERDISLNNINRKIERSEKRYRHLFENNPLPMWVIDEGSDKFLDVNEAALDHYGYNRQEFLSMSTLDIRPGEEKERYQRYIRKESYSQGNWKHRKKDGTLINVEVFAHNLSFDGRKARLILANDITDRLKAEEQLNRTIKEITDYKFALDESSIVAITDQKGIIKHVNDNFCRISKYDAGELLGQDHRIVNSGYHTKEFIRNLWITIANGKIWRGEIQNRAKDGTIYWVDTTIVPFLNESAKPYQYIAIRADITDRKIAEEENHKLNEDLEQRVKQRTEELEAFSYSVSHDLRAPLRAINGFSKMLDEEYSAVFDPEATRLFKRIAENAKKMGILIDDLLEFSKLGRKEIHRSPVGMTELAEETLSEINTTLHHKASVHIHPLHAAYVDNTLIKQVMVNLISNALKYSSKAEKPAIEIKSYQAGDEIIYAISDNGVGFDNQYAGKLFGVFQRLHLQKDFEGTGVGLALVKRIIDKHGGRVWAEGELNKGATFFFSLPTSNYN